jgi:hypothetical protein
VKGGLLVLTSAAWALVFAAPAAADGWLPHAQDATWTYQWTDSVYNPTPTNEKVTVQESKGKSFTLRWTTEGQGNAPEAPTSLGTISYQESNAGLINTDWSSNPPPSTFPVLCSRISFCNNSIASTQYLLIWGTRSPVLAEPLLSGARWSGAGGALGDVTATSEYQGTEQVTVPAFPEQVLASKVRSELTQAGALGDPYGSGVRTVWWVYGVGPVKIVFEHQGGDAPVTTSVLKETNQKPLPPPGDANYFPLTKGSKLRYRWTNTKHLKQASVTEIAVDEVVNSTARFSAKHVSGPIKLAAAYIFTERLDGVYNVSVQERAATRVALPPLGPKSAPKDRRRHFFTPFDLMLFGYNPILPAYPAVGNEWASKAPSRDYSVFGVTGSTKITGTQQVKVPAGTFRALVVRSKLTQAGFPFGSGTRTSYFAPGKGLVKLVFRHGDGSTSTVDLVR